jgi:hypothetical protein
MIRHVVTWKLKAEDAAGKAAGFAAMAGALGSLPPLVPEIRTLQIGQDIAETEGNWDVVLIVDCATTADLVAYQAHPEHQKAVAIVREHTAARSSVDFEL